jgi:hypothetical protein
LLEALLHLIQPSFGFLFHRTPFIRHRLRDIARCQEALNRKPPIAAHHGELLLTGQAIDLPPESGMFLFNLSPSAVVGDQSHTPGMSLGSTICSFGTSRCSPLGRRPVPGHVVGSTTNGTGPGAPTFNRLKRLDSSDERLDLRRSLPWERSDFLTKHDENRDLFLQTPDSSVHKSRAIWGRPKNKSEFTGECRNSRGSVQI